MEEELLDHHHQILPPLYLDKLELVVVEVAPDPPTTMNEVVMVDLALLL